MRLPGLQAPRCPECRASFPECTPEEHLDYLAAPVPDIRDKPILMPALISHMQHAIEQGWVQTDETARALVEKWWTK